MITDSDIVEAARALGVRDVVARQSGGVVTIRAVLRDAQRMRWDAVHAAVALEALFPRAGHAWRPVCCLCVDSLDVASCMIGGAEIESHRINLDTGHDTGCCSFCGACGRDTLVAAVADTSFAAPPAAFIASRCGYADGGGRLANLNKGDRS